MEQTNKVRRVVTMSVVIVNGTISLLLIIAMVYLFIQVTYQQQEIKKFRTMFRKMKVADKRVFFCA